MTAGTYLVKGKLATFRDDELLVIAGRHKITGGRERDELKVNLNLDDTSLAQPGDEVKVKAWYYDTGRPNRESRPPRQRDGRGDHDHAGQAAWQPPARKPAQIERPARASSKSKVSK